MLTYVDLVNSPDADAVLEALQSGESVDDAEACLWHARVSACVVEGPIDPVGDKVVFVRVSALDAKPTASSCTLTVRGGLPGGAGIPLTLVEGGPRRRGAAPHTRFAVGDGLALHRCCVRVERGCGVALTVNVGYDGTVYNFGRRADKDWPEPTAESIADLAVSWMVLGSPLDHSRAFQLCNAELKKVVAAPRCAPQILERLSMLFLRRGHHEAALGYANAAIRLHGGRPGVRGVVVAAAAAAASGRFAAARHLLEQVRGLCAVRKLCALWLTCARCAL